MTLFRFLVKQGQRKRLSLALFTLNTMAVQVRVNWPNKGGKF